jgi:hypothetical protein
MSIARTFRFPLLLLLCSAALAACQLRSQESALAHAERTFAVHLDAPFEQALPLFTPAGEREWVPDWSPHMIFPADSSSPAKGSVFITSDKDGDEIWIVTAYDAQHGFISYVAVLPGHVVTEIEVRVEKQGENKSIADVTHRRTALSAAGNHMVSALSDNVGGHAAHWEHAINEALRKRRENVSR